MSTHIEIADNGTLDYEEPFYAGTEADALFEELRADTPWQQERGRMGPFPRLTAWYADTGLTYAYSGVVHQALPWTPTLRRIRVQVEAAAHASFNSLLLNFYRDGHDSIGYHADDEPELGTNPIIASVSLGGVRTFILKHNRSKEKITYHLAHGSLLVMGGTCQHHWVHGVPKTKAPAEPRINLTFRNIFTAGD